MRTLIALFAAALTLNLVVAFAAASCIEESLADRAKRADLVAYGRLDGDRFEIRQILKGTANGVITVRLGASGGAVTSVDYIAANGTDQTLYLRLEGNEYVTDACSGSHAGMPTADERAFFGAGTGPEVWTMGPGVGEADAAASGQTVALAVAAALLGAGAIAFIAFRRRSTRVVA